MTLTSQSMNSKTVSAVTSTNKTSQKNDSSESKGVGFEALFASAMGAGKSQGTMSQLENQLQQNLTKQEEQKKQPQQPLSDLNGVASAVQAAVWAQRDYASANSTEAAKISGTSAVKPNEQAGQTSQKQELKPAENGQAQNRQAEAPRGNEMASKPADSKSQAANGTETKAAQQTTPAQSSNSAVDTQAAGQGDLTASPVEEADAALQAAMKNAGKDAESVGIKPNTEVGDKATVVRDTSAPQATQTQAADNKGIEVKVATTDASAKTTDSSKAGDTTGIEAKTQIRSEDVSNNRSTNAASDARHAQADARQAQAEARQAAAQRSDVVAAAQQQASARGQSGKEIQAGDRKLVTGGVGASNSANGSGQAGAALAPLSTTRTGLANEASIKTPVNQPGFAKELGEKVNWAIGKNLSTVDIKLNPEQFGNMSMRLVQKGQQLHLTIRTTEESTGAMMSQAVHGLRETLAQSGLQLTQFQVQTPSQQSAANNQPQFGQSQQDQASSGQNSSGNGNGQQQGRSGSGGSQPQADISGDSRPVRTTRPDSNLDLFA